MAIHLNLGNLVRDPLNDFFIYLKFNRFVLEHKTFFSKLCAYITVYTYLSETINAGANGFLIVCYIFS